MKVTKKPKSITVYHKEVKSYTSEYQCPSCGIHIIGAGLRANVLRFKCDCGQELIVERHLTTASTLLNAVAFAG